MNILKGLKKSIQESILFHPIDIENLRIKNRFVRSSTHDSMQTQDGYITEMSINYLLQLAKGGVGLIITGAANTQKGSRVDYQISAASDNFIPGFKMLVDQIHNFDVKIAIQLNSYGLSPQAAREGQISLAPSLIDGMPYIIPKHRAMTVDEIEEIIESFGDAAKRAKQAGFDAVQIHMGHGYLFSQFLSPFTNRRIDGYGGALEGRMRIHIETLERVRKKVGVGYPLLVKLGLKDEVGAGGLSLAEGCQVAEAFADRGVAAIEVSQGLDLTVFQSKKIPISVERRRTHIRRDILKRSNEAYYLHWCSQVREIINSPLFLVGGLRSFDIMEDIVQSGVADCVSMSRPFIREPTLINRWFAGDLKKSKCISCNECRKLIRKYRPLFCMQEQNLIQGGDKLGTRAQKLHK